MNLIEELYFGSISPSSKINIESPSYLQAMNTVSKNEELLAIMLDGESKRLFFATIDAYSTILGEQNVANFVAGFRLGAGLMAEVSPTEIEPYLRE